MINYLLSQLAHDVLFDGDRCAHLFASTAIAHDLEQLEVGEVVEAQRRVHVEATRQARVLIAQHLFHLRLIAGKHDGNVLARRTVNLMSNMGQIYLFEHRNFDGRTFSTIVSSACLPYIESSRLYASSINNTFPCYK